MGGPIAKSIKYIFTGQYNAGDGNDHIVAVGFGGTVNAYGGDDTITVGGFVTTVNTGEGNDKVYGGSAVLHVNDTNGYLSVNGAAGFVDIDKNGSGDLDFNGAGGRVEIRHTGASGDIQFRGAAVSNYIYRSGTSGSIDFRGAGASNQILLYASSGNLSFDGAGAYNELTSVVDIGSLTMTGAGASNIINHTSNSGDTIFEGVGGYNKITRHGGNAYSDEVIFRGGGAYNEIIHDAYKGNTFFEGAGGYNKITRTGYSGSVVFTGAGVSNVITHKADDGHIVFKGGGGFNVIERRGISGHITFHGAGASNVIKSYVRSGNINFIGGGAYNSLQLMGTAGNVTMTGAGASNSIWHQTETGDTTFKGVGGENYIRRKGGDASTGNVTMEAGGIRNIIVHTTNTGDTTFIGVGGENSITRNGGDNSSGNVTVMAVGALNVINHATNSGNTEFGGVGAGNIITRRGGVGSTGNVRFVGAGFANVVTHTTDYGDTLFEGGGGANVVKREGISGNLKFVGAGVANVITHNVESGNLDVTALGGGNIVTGTGNGSTKLVLAGGVNGANISGSGDLDAHMYGGANVLSKSGSGHTTASLGGALNIVRVGDGGSDIRSYGLYADIQTGAGYDEIRSYGVGAKIHSGGAPEGQKDYVKTYGAYTDIDLSDDVGSGKTVEALSTDEFLASLDQDVEGVDLSGGKDGLQASATQQGKSKYGLANIGNEMASADTAGGVSAGGPGGDGNFDIEGHLAQDQYAGAMQARDGDGRARAESEYGTAESLQSSGVDAEDQDGFDGDISGPLPTFNNDEDVDNKIEARGIATDIKTGGGNDYIIAGSILNVIETNDGSDRVIATAGLNLINTGAGNDYARLIGAANYADMGSGNDYAILVGLVNIVQMGSGDDRVVSVGIGNVILKHSDDEASTEESLWAVLVGAANVLVYTGDGDLEAYMLAAGQVVVKNGDGDVRVVMVSPVGFNVAYQHGAGFYEAYMLGVYNISTKEGDGFNGVVMVGMGNVHTNIGDGDGAYLAIGGVNIITKVGEGNVAAILVGIGNVFTHTSDITHESHDSLVLLGQGNVVTKVGDGDLYLLALAVPTGAFLVGSSWAANVVTQVGTGNAFGMMLAASTKYAANVFTKVGDGDVAMLMAGLTSDMLKDLLGSAISVAAPDGLSLALNVFTQVGNGQTNAFALGALNVIVKVGHGEAESRWDGWDQDKIDETLNPDGKTAEWDEDAPTVADKITHGMQNAVDWMTGAGGKDLLDTTMVAVGELNAMVEVNTHKDKPTDTLMVGIGSFGNVMVKAGDGRFVGIAATTDTFDIVKRTLFGAGRVTGWDKLKVKDFTFGNLIVHAGDGPSWMVTAGSNNVMVKVGDGTTGPASDGSWSANGLRLALGNYNVSYDHGVSDDIMLILSATPSNDKGEPGLIGKIGSFASGEWSSSTSWFKTKGTLGVPNILTQKGWEQVGQLLTLGFAPFSNDGSSWKYNERSGNSQINKIANNFSDMFNFTRKNGASAGRTAGLNHGATESIESGNEISDALSKIYGQIAEAWGTGGNLVIAGAGSDIVITVGGMNVVFGDTFASILDMSFASFMPANGQAISLNEFIGMFYKGPPSATNTGDINDPAKQWADTVNAGLYEEHLEQNRKTLSGAVAQGTMASVDFLQMFGDIGFTVPFATFGEMFGIRYGETGALIADFDVDQLYAYLLGALWIEPMMPSSMLGGMLVDAPVTAFGALKDLWHDVSAQDAAQWGKDALDQAASQFNFSPDILDHMTNTDASDFWPAGGFPVIPATPSIGSLIALINNFEGITQIGEGGALDNAAAIFAKIKPMSAHGDILVATGIANFQFGGHGDDIIVGFGDVNRSFAGEGDDILVSFGQFNYQTGNSGDDMMLSIGKFNVVHDMDGNNFIAVIGEKNDIRAGSGNDFIFVLGDKNKVRSGNGVNFVIAMGNKNSIYLSGSSIVFGFGAENNYYVDGGEGSKTLIYNLGAASISLSPGGKGFYELGGGEIIGSSGDDYIAFTRDSDGGNLYGDDRLDQIGDHNRSKDTILMRGKNTVAWGGYGGAKDRDFYIVGYGLKDGVIQEAGGSKVAFGDETEDRIVLGEMIGVADYSGRILDAPVRFQREGDDLRIYMPDHALYADNPSPLDGDRLNSVRVEDYFARFGDQAAQIVLSLWDDNFYQAYDVNDDDLPESEKGILPKWQHEHDTEEQNETAIQAYSTHDFSHYTYLTRDGVKALIDAYDNSTASTDAERWAKAWASQWDAASGTWREDGAVKTGADLSDFNLGQSKGLMIAGGSGADTIRGTSLDDVLEGGAGDDTLDGGDGVDTASYSYVSNTAGVTVDLVAGKARVGAIDAPAEIDTLTNIESVLGSAYGDTLTGNNGDNELKGNAGDDYLVGGGGNDALSGGAGNDTLSGGGGNDTFSYGKGDGGDIILADGNDDSSSDRLVFAGDIAASGLWFSQVGEDLFIDVLDSASDGGVTLRGWYGAGITAAGRLDSLEVGGHTLDLASAHMQSLVQAMAAWSDSNKDAIDDDRLGAFQDNATGLQTALAAWTGPAA